MWAFTLKLEKRPLFIILVCWLLDDFMAFYRLIRFFLQVVCFLRTGHILFNQSSYNLCTSIYTGPMLRNRGYSQAVNLLVDLTQLFVHSEWSMNFSHKPILFVHWWNSISYTYNYIHSHVHCHLGVWLICLPSKDSHIMCSDISRG